VDDWDGVVFAGNVGIDGTDRVETSFLTLESPLSIFKIPVIEGMLMGGSFSDLVDNSDSSSSLSDILLNSSSSILNILLNFFLLFFSSMS